MTKGVLMFAHNNGVIEYHRMAVMAAWFVKKNLGVPICLAGDPDTLDELAIHPGADLFDHIVPTDYTGNTKRRYKSIDGDEVKTRNGDFLNTSRPSALDLTPFDETLMIDTDYLVMNDRLNECWGSTAPIRINHHVENVAYTLEEESRRIQNTSILQYWATVLYFKKSNESETLFDLMRYVQANYEHFARVYGFSSNLYRNDHAISIAVHLMNGGLGENAPSEIVNPLPEPSLWFAWDNQPVLKMDDTSLWFAGRTNGPANLWTPGYTKGESIHVMNKRSLIDKVVPVVEDQL